MTAMKKLDCTHTQIRSPSQKPVKAREDIAEGQLLSHYRNVLMNAVLGARDALTQFCRDLYCVH